MDKKIKIHYILIILLPYKKQLLLLINEFIFLLVNITLHPIHIPLLDKFF